MRATLSKTFQSLTVRNFRIFTVGTLVKSMGTWMLFIAQNWLVLGLSGDSATALGIVTALQFTPVLLFTLLSGRLADRYDKRHLLFASSSLWAALSIAMSVLVLTGAVRLWHVYVFAALLGISSAIDVPVRQAFVSEMVGAPLLPNALSLTSATFNSTRIVGPAVAGVGIAVLGVGPVFLVSAIAALAPIVALLRMSVADLHRDDLPAGFARDPALIADGLRYVRQRPDLVLPLVLICVIGMSAFNYQITLAALAKTVFDTGAASFGLFTTALAIGSLGGALAGGGRRERPSAYVVLFGGIGFGGFTVLVGLAHTFWLAVALLVPTGFFMLYFVQAGNQRVQLGVDAAYRGRVMALWVLLFLGTNPITAPLVGWVAEHLGANASIYLGGIISTMAAVVGLVWQLRHTDSRLRLRLRPSVRLQVVPAVERR